MVKALVFDAYGTLFDVHSVLGRCEEVFPGHGSDLTSLWRSKQLQYTWLRSLMDRYENFWRITEEALRFACESLALNASQEQIDHVMQAYLSLSPFSEITDALDALDSLPCSVLSNGTLTMLQSAVESAGLEGRFEHILSVDEVRTYKPNPVVYQLTELHLGVERGRIGFVSSNCWDVVGAKAFGLQSYWLNRQCAPLEVLGFQPDGIIHTAMELPAIVG
jgi:2-haloacid dehalogenase